MAILIGSSLALFILTKTPICRGPAPHGAAGAMIGGLTLLKG